MFITGNRKSRYFNTVKSARAKRLRYKTGPYQLDVQCQDVFLEHFKERFERIDAPLVREVAQDDSDERERRDHLGPRHRQHLARLSTATQQTP